MITVRMDPVAVARVRLAPSPASEISAWLGLTADGAQHPLLGDPGPSARFALRHSDVALLADVLRGAIHYVPDLLTPKPPPGPWPQTLGRQLELVRETPDADVVTQVLVETFHRRRMPAEVRRAMESGTFARRAANGLYRFWHTALADGWPTLNAAAAMDVRVRSRTMAAHGVGQVLDTLHPKVRWFGDHLRVDLVYDETTHLDGRDLVLAPSVLGWPRMRSQVCDPRNAVLAYPVREFDHHRHQGAPTLVTLVGRTRAAILTSLTAASSTTELSRRHGLAPSTVSHHLGVLLRAGMVVKARRGSVVQYERTERADAIVRISEPVE
jgi:DNA-binding transcriptional ArsR family regulator